MVEREEPVPLRAGGTGLRACGVYSNTNGLGDCAASAVHVMVMPKTTICREPPYASRLSPEATVPSRGPTETPPPAAMAGFFVPVKAVVPPLAFTMVRVEVIESWAMLIGAVISVELRVMVAAVPVWVAVRVASPLPPMLQVALMVAVWG